VIVPPLAKLSDLNRFDLPGFIAACGPLFEHSPWIAERTWPHRPFATVDQLHAVLIDAMYNATDAEQIKLISSHPDLVGRLAREGRLTAESTAEQAHAGLTQLSPDDAEAFDRYNAAYKAKFSFPFVICARENKKDAILRAFPIRLNHDRETEIATALAEIAKIARLRLLDAVTDG
jgi:2-oxo-4-hydroxy-4-carboxy-5-ureidoimidazoline decarboxylase